MDKHLVAIQGLLEKLNSADSTEAVKEDVQKARNILQEADKVLQVYGSDWKSVPKLCLLVW